MAYRQFYEPIAGQVTDYTPISDGVASLFQSITQADKARRTAGDQFKYALEYGDFETDNQLLSEYTKSVTNKARNDFHRYGRLSAETQSMMTEGQELSANSKAQAKRALALSQQIDKKATEDPYYDPAVDKNILQRATVGEDGELNVYRRGAELDSASKVIGNDPQSFRAKKYTADWVKLYGEKEKERITSNPNAKSTTLDSSVFWDDRTGSPGVTDNHAIDYIKSDARVDRHYTWQMDQNLADEIKKMKSSGDSRVAWMKGMSEAEIKDELIRNPEKNLINPQDFGVRKREMAKRDLEDAAKIKRKVDVETKIDTKVTGGLYTNDAIAYSPTFYNTPAQFEFKTGGGESVEIGGHPDGTHTQQAISNLSAPGGILMISKGVTTGKPINFDIESPNAYNIKSGRKTQIVGKQPFNLTGYQLQVYRKDGTPLPVKANSFEDYIAKIESMSPEEFKELAPTPMIALNGYSLDRTRMLGDVSNVTYNLNAELGKAIAAGDQEKEATIENRIAMIEEFKQNINNGEIGDEDLLSLAARNEITGIRTDQLVRAERSDLDKLNNITGGLNLNDRAKWSPEMKKLDEVYRRKYAEANQSATPAPKTKAKPSSVPTIDNDEDYAKLPSGAEFIAPDGKRYKKP